MSSGSGWEDELGGGASQHCSLDVPDHLPLRQQSRSETNTTAAHRLPWETLLAICKQADQSTVAQLCLVSFGMVELAGPVLYEHVALASPEAIRSFFIEVG